MKEKHIVKLNDNKINRVVQDLNKILDEHNIIGQEWNKQVIKELIINNLTKNTTIELMKELDNMPISEWND